MVITVYICPKCDINTDSGKPLPHPEFLTHPKAVITDVDRICKCKKSTMVRVENDINEVGV